MKLNVDAKTIKARIASIKGRSAKLDRDIHETAVQCLAHAAEHGDVTLCGKLVEAMGNASRKADMIQWFSTFGPVRINRNTFDAKQIKKTDEAYVPYDVETATNKPFWTLFDDKPGRPIGLSDVIGVLFSKRKAATEAHEAGRYVGDFEADMAILDAAIKATGMTEDDLEEVRERTRNLKSQWEPKQAEADAEPAF